MYHVDCRYPNIRIYYRLMVINANVWIIEIFYVYSANTAFSVLLSFVITYLLPVFDLTLLFISEQLQRQCYLFSLAAMTFQYAQFS